MADFCRQCSIDILGEDFKDLAGLISQEKCEEGWMTGAELCEGCGPTQVNHLGECQSPDCMKDGHKGYEMIYKVIPLSQRNQETT